MAFHVACPITCRKICFCALGFPRRLQGDKGRNEFLQEVAVVEQFLNDPWLIKARENATVQVKVPKVVVSPAQLPQPPQFSTVPAAAVGGEESALSAASAQVKRVALQKQAAAASMVAEDYARRFESGDLTVSEKDAAGEEQGLSNAKVMCRLCFSGEYEGSERAKKMLSCKSCGKKYHRSCLKAWSQNRDLFHWSSWTCPSCRICEVCRRTGDPNKFMFCKRCDGAYHCYCQQPPHKNVGHGPYLCPKHTKCHSCGSSVPGNGLSVRWFLGYTCCDACGRLFVKGNYCPVCLKVYRDSESTPMVCCDICQHWVHCPCDGISDAKYMQFQVDGNLQYVCPTCRGESSQVRNLEEAIQELWKRRDEADKDLIASLRAAVGLPTQEEIFDISPFSDDEDSGPIKNEYSRSLKFSLKGLGDKSPRKNKEYGKKSSKKYGKKKGTQTSFNSRTEAHHSFGGHGDGPLLGYNSGDNKNEEIQYSGEPTTSSPAAGILDEGVNDAAVSKQKYIDEVSKTGGTKASRTIKIKNNKPQGVTNREDSGANSGMLKSAQGPKLVIHLGGRNRNTTSPPRSEASNFKGGQDLNSSNAFTEDTNQPKHHDTATKFGDQKGHKMDHADKVKTSKLREKEGPTIKFKNVSSEVSNIGSKLTGGESSDVFESVSPHYTHSSLGKRGTEGSASPRSESEVPVGKRNKYSSMKCGEDRPTVSGDLIDDNSNLTSMSQASSNDRKPYLKFKIPKNSNNGSQNVPSNLNSGNQNPLPLPGKEITYTRGQRSKRKRPAVGDGDTSQWRDDNPMKEFTDANWILQKLGKDAAGKRVEIHQSSNNTWRRGTVVEVVEGTSMVSIALDDGPSKNYELGKQGIRFISQKLKH
ncbi:putative transcription factor HALR/MLL3, involved in embryonic development [Handroanthus impetiginosus]|uniref:Putative transcription factor HALR/MLL3, involved in embryonic development n=1 Tax=Handroanthus impetiginosus TaxID=429701 RepID=A0A2G9H995_9LAMI|nr:putative transcription factor HALR/MLL3, involved in embryonic development [Handroanthus impetiginosus]